MPVKRFKPVADVEFIDQKRVLRAAAKLYQELEEGGALLPKAGGSQARGLIGQAFIEACTVEAAAARQVTLEWLDREEAPGGNPGG